MTRNHKHLYGLIIVLIGLGLSIFFYRHFALGVPLLETEEVNSWTVEANLQFTAVKNVPVKAELTIPYMPPNFSILDEYFVSQNYGVTTNLVGDNREVVWSLRRGSGPQSLYYRAIFRESGSPNSSLSKPSPAKPRPLPEKLKSAVETITSQARETSADIQTFAQRTIKELNKKNGNAKLLTESQFDAPNIIDAAIIILNQARIAAMPVKGIYLSQQNRATLDWYLAVYNEKEWIYIHPKTGAAGLPHHFLVWQYGDAPILNVLGGKKSALTLTISETPINALNIAKARGQQTESELLRFSLLQLPISAQEMYKILLMIPIGAFIILILRNFVGLSTFGTFMPVLIALAFRETHVIWGVFIFTFIVSVGLLARFYLDQLKLLVVPRLSAILTVVIILMILISVIGQNLGANSGLSVALFPMVILTMTIERMCITWDERGAFEAIKSGIGSLGAAVICYSVMCYPPLQYLIFAFPELLLVLLGFILWFGQYRGYRLFELFRFNELAEENR